MVERRTRARGRRYADETLWYYCELVVAAAFLIGIAVGWLVAELS